MDSLVAIHKLNIKRLDGICIVWRIKISQENIEWILLSVSHKVKIIKYWMDFEIKYKMDSDEIPVPTMVHTNLLLPVLRHQPSFKV